MPGQTSSACEMRIGFDATVLGSGTRYTGTGQYAARLLEYMPRLAAEDEFIVYVTGGTAAGLAENANVRVRKLKPLPGGKLSALATHLLRFPGLMRRDGLDVLHVPTVHTRLSLPPVPRLAPCPVVVTLHDIIPITFYGRTNGAMPWRLRRYYRWNLAAAANAQRIITVSETSRREIVANLGVPEWRVSAIYNGIDFEAWSDTPAGVANPYSGKRPYVLFGGSYEPRKNLPRLLEAFDIAVREGLEHDLVMVVDAGSGYEPAIRRYASTLACRERLHFMSAIDERSLVALYRNANVFLFPSLSEGFGFPPLQAMASGVPVITSDLPVLREVLGDAAMFVDPYNVNTVAGAIRTVVSDAATRQRLTAAGRDRASAYSWSDSARRTLDVLRSACEERV